MSARGRHAGAGPSENVAHHETARRRHDDDRTRERIREIPAWATSQLDFALARGLVRDEDLPGTAAEITDVVREYGWTLTPLAQLVGAAFLHEREVQLMSWRGRASVCRIALESGSDLADKIAELRAVAA